MKYPEGTDEARQGAQWLSITAVARHHDALKTCAASSRCVSPWRYDADETMSKATFNRITMAIVERAKQKGLALQPFTVHDLRRSGSTLLHELGFNSDWIEKFRP